MTPAVEPVRRSGAAVPAKQALRRSAGERAEWRVERGRLAGDTLSKAYQLLLFKGRAVGGGLSDTRRGARRQKLGSCEGEAGVGALRRLEGGVAGGTRPLGGAYIPLLGRVNPK